LQESDCARESCAVKSESECERRKVAEHGVLGGVRSREATTMVFSAH
jgi:hypothetical protein